MADAPTSLGVEPAVPKTTNALLSQLGGEKQQLQREYEKFQERKQQTQQELSTSLAGVPLPSMPEAPPEIHPRQASEFMPLMMIMATLGGLSTKTPMVAAMGNLNGVLQGQMQGDTARVESERQKLHDNFELGMSKYRMAMDERRAIYEKNKGDQKAIDEEIHLWALKHGLDERIEKLGFQAIDAADKAAAKAQEHKDNLGFKKSEADRRADEKKDAEARKSKEGIERRKQELRLAKDKAMAKTSDAKKKADIAALYDKEIADLDVPGAAPAAAASSAPKTFSSEAEAEAAFKDGTIHGGDKVIIGGVSGTWQ